MAALRNVGRLSSALFSVGRRCYSKKYDIDTKDHFTPEWMPGEYPKTEEERLHAAEKYGIHPDEYKPLQPHEFAGDYPDLKAEGYDARDPLYPWDEPDYRRGWNEPLHEDDDMLGADKYTIEGVRQRTDPTAGSIFGVVFILVVWFVMYYQDEPHHQLMEKNYIYIDDKPPKKCYTFDIN